MPSMAVVTGAGGFIGHHLVTYLKKRGWTVRGVDISRPSFGASDADEFHIADLRDPTAANAAVEGATEVYALAADMGGMGYLTSAPASILRNNMLINAHTLEAARLNGVTRYFFASSACVYPEHAQNEPDVPPLREPDAYPAQPQDSYGWEKLVTERLCAYYHEQYGLTVRIARYHNVYGPFGTYQGGREKAPAALCRKIALASPNGTFEVWGDGRQTRSFCYINDCLEGTYRLMRSDYAEPLNIGSDQLVTISELAEIIVRVSGKTELSPVYIPGPQGVRGRNSDNTLIRETLEWSPSISLESGLRETYQWIAAQVSQETAKL